MNRLSRAERAQIIRALVEGNSIRSTSRMTGAARNTITTLLVELGIACATYQDKVLRNLEALLVVADAKYSFLLSGNGDVIAPDEGVLAIGSGGSYALAAARALLKHTTLSARQIAEEALRISGEICIYSNQHIIVEEL